MAFSHKVEGWVSGIYASLDVVNGKYSELFPSNHHPFLAEGYSYCRTHWASEASPT